MQSSVCLPSQYTGSSTHQYVPICFLLVLFVLLLLQLLQMIFHFYVLNMLQDNLYILIWQKFFYDNGDNKVDFITHCIKEKSTIQVYFTFLLGTCNNASEYPFFWTIKGFKWADHRTYTYIKEAINQLLELYKFNYGI